VANSREVSRFKHRLQSCLRKLAQQKAALSIIRCPKQAFRARRDVSAPVCRQYGAGREASHRGLLTSQKAPEGMRRQTV
jgi:hypothetical protein